MAMETDAGENYNEDTTPAIVSSDDEFVEQV